MPNLLQQAFDKASQLSPDEQDTVAAWLISELASERRWQTLFDQSPEVLSKLAAEASAEDEAGETQPLDPESL